MANINNTKVYSYRRVSKAIQATKAGINRQIKAAEDWCKKYGYDLDYELDDKGLSAWSGANAEHGELGKFIQACKSGAVPKGSILLVENLDRLSRKKVPDAMRQFLELTGLGLEIVTLVDGMRYSDKSIGENGAELMWSLMTMIRANEESEIKSKRVRDGKRTKFEKARNGKDIAHGSPPRWLSVKQVNGEYQVNEHAQTIRLIFDLSINGYGANAIAEELIERGIERPNGHVQKKNVGHWTPTDISRILKSKSVYGLLESTKNDREPIENYYPEIVSKEVFALAQEAIQSRTRVKAKTKTMNNLFSGFAVCGYCGGKLGVNSRRVKGRDVSKTYGRSYFCNRKANKLQPDCITTSKWAYPFEKAILETVPVLDITTKAKVDLRPRLKMEISELEEQQTRIVNAITLTDTPPAVLLERLTAIEEGIRTKQAELSEAQQCQNVPIPAVNYQKADIEDILDKGNLDLRKKTHANLQRVINRIVFHDSMKITVIELHNGLVYVLEHGNNDYSDVLIHHDTPANILLNWGVDVR